MGCRSLSVPVCGVGLRPEVLKCMSAAPGSRRVRAAATAAAVVLKRTAPECLAAAAATVTRRRRGPAAPARGRLGRGGGRRQPHRRPALLAAAGLGPEPAARAGASTLQTVASPPSPSARRLSGHPRSPLRREKARQPRGLGGRRREWALRPCASLTYCSWLSDAPRSPCHGALLIQTLLSAQPTAEPSSHRPYSPPRGGTPPLPNAPAQPFNLPDQTLPPLSSPLSELIRNLWLTGSPSSTLTATETCPQTESPSSPILSST